MICKTCKVDKENDLADSFFGGVCFECRASEATDGGPDEADGGEPWGPQHIHGPPRPEPSPPAPRGGFATVLERAASAQAQQNDIRDQYALAFISGMRDPIEALHDPEIFWRKLDAFMAERVKQ